MEDRPTVLAAPDLPLGDRVLPTASRVVVMGVLNVTPDSFSDGGLALDPDDHPTAAIAAGRMLAGAGADVIDVGGESTRPGAAPVDVDTELARVVPVVAALAGEGLTVSVDTTKARVAREAIAAGARLVNDVSAGTFDPELLGVVADADVGYVLMHLKGTPATMQIAPTYDDVVAEVEDVLASGLERLETAGIARERVAVDPGIGFGKTLEHNLALLADLGRLAALGRPVLVGASRKSFIGAITGVVEPRARLAGSLAAALAAVERGARIVRVHDVAPTCEALAVLSAIEGGTSPIPPSRRVPGGPA
ncbi:MAG: dihydropteroate synthase [Actinomycetota bacterium]